MRKLYNDNNVTSLIIYLKLPEVCIQQGFNLL